VEEIEEHLKAGKPAMLYFSNAPVRPDSVNDKQYKALTAFKHECYTRGLVESYDLVTEFREKFTRQLAQTLIRDFAINTIEASEPTKPAPPLVRDLLTEDAKELLFTAANDDGQILFLRTFEGVTIQAAKRNFIGQQTPKEAARWQSALNELDNHGLIEGRGGRGEVFEVTYNGHKVAEEVGRQQGRPNP
jgi:hypothetical protein